MLITRKCPKEYSGKINQDKTWCSARGHQLAGKCVTIDREPLQPMSLCNPNQEAVPLNPPFESTRAILLGRPTQRPYMKAPPKNRQTAKKHTAIIATAEAPTAIPGSNIFPWKVPRMTTAPMAGAVINEAITQTVPRQHSES
jgi:hypothetical protein